MFLQAHRREALLRECPSHCLEDSWLKLQTASTALPRPLGSAKGAPFLVNLILAFPGNEKLKLQGSESVHERRFSVPCLALTIEACTWNLTRCVSPSLPKPSRRNSGARCKCHWPSLPYDHDRVFLRSLGRASIDWIFHSRARKPASSGRSRCT